MDTYLDKLEILGFKSFPEKTVLKFHKGITAVIGPNGCGKSNIVDSILWVMGEQRIKNLRGENNEDLIFSGSSSKKPLGMVEVGAFFSTQSEDISIARRFFRTGEGKYLLNDRYCRGKDIQDVLFKLRLGGRNYFIFEQGSIEKLVSLKPSERRMLIEESAGISQYLVRKKETANKLIIAEQNLDNIQVLLVDKDNRLKELRNQVNYVQRYRRAKNDKVSHLKTLLKRQNDKFQADFKHHKDEIEKLIDHESIMVKDISELEKEMMKLEEKRWLLDKDLKLNQQKIFEVNKKTMACKNEIDRSKQTGSFKNQRILELKRSNENNSKEITDIEKQLEKTGSDLNDLQKQLDTQHSGFDELESRQVDLNDRLEDLHKNNAGLKSDIFNVQGELTRVSNAIKEIDKRMSRIDNEIATKKNFVSQLHAQVSSQEIDETAKHIESLSREFQEKESLFKEVEKAFEKNKQAVEELSAENKNLGNELRNLDNQKEKYLQIKKKIVGETSDLSGIRYHGLLQDLIHSDKKYHKILENFYFDEMDAILLVENNDLLNRSTPLNKCLLNREPGPATPASPYPITDEEYTAITRETGFIAWVKDLYTLKKDAGPALKTLFRNGVLVDNLKNGIRIFVHYGVAVVTENAETINNAGLLVRNREKGILDVIEEIRDIDAQKMILSEKINRVQQLLDKEKRLQPGLASDTELYRSGLRKLDKEILQLKTGLDTLKKNRETNLKRVNVTETEIQLHNSEKDKLQSEFETLDLKNAELEERSSLLNQQRDRYQEDALRLKEEINRAEKEYLQKENTVNLIKEKINSSNSRIRGLKNTGQRLETNIKTNEQEIVKLTAEIDELKKNEASAAKDIENHNREKNELDTLVQGQEEEFNRLNIVIKDNNSVMNTKRKKLEELKENRQQLEIGLSSIKKDLFQLEDLSFKELNTELKNIDAEPELADLPLDQLEKLIEEFNDRLIKMRDSNRLNFSAESEFELLTKDFSFLLTQKEDVIKSIADMNEAIKKIDDESRVSFMDAFNEIKENFKKNFAILFEGGEAELSLMDDSDVLETGLDIKAQPPGKRLLSLNLLSGGEKTLTSLAFLFALFQYKPSPFCVFDEVDASLDEANIQRFLKFLHNLKQNTQFLIITHNFKTMEEADYIYGISMNEPGISTIYSMKMTGKGQIERA